MNERTKTGVAILQAAALISSLAMFLFSCESEVGNLAVDLPTSNADIRTPEEIQPLISPTPVEAFNIHSTIGIADVRDGGIGCLRTKNGNLAVQSPVSVIISLDEPPQRILSATIQKMLGKSCARYASESGDKNAGENFFYSFTFNDDGGEQFGFDNGIAVIRPEKPILIQDGLAAFDLNDDGKPEYFRSCSGFEGMHFTIWTGKPLKGKRIWHSFYYLDYNTDKTCSKKDWGGIDDE